MVIQTKAGLPIRRNPGRHVALQTAPAAVVAHAAGVKEFDASKVVGMVDGHTPRAASAIVSACALGKSGSARTCDGQDEDEDGPKQHNVCRHLLLQIGLV